MTLYTKAVIFTDHDAVFELQPNGVHETLPHCLLTNSGDVLIQHRSADPMTLNLYTASDGRVQEIASDDYVDLNLSDTGFVWTIRGKVSVKMPDGTFQEADGYLLRLYDGTAVETIAQGEGISNPRIANDGTIFYVDNATRSGESKQVIVFLYVKDSDPRELVSWDWQIEGDLYAHPTIWEFLTNASGQKLAYLLVWEQTKGLTAPPVSTSTWQELHLLSPNGDDRMIGEKVYRNLADHPEGARMWSVSINESSWLAWAVVYYKAETTGTVDHVSLYFYDGVGVTETAQTDNPEGAWPYLNNQGQVVYGDLRCNRSDFFLYDHTTRTTVNVTKAFGDATGLKYNGSPNMNNWGRIVWSTTDHVESSPPGGDPYITRSPATTTIFTSDSGAYPLKLGPGFAPEINDRGQIVYWDHNAGEIVLLTPVDLNGLVREGYDVRNLVLRPPSDTNIVFDRGHAYEHGTDLIDLSKPF